MSLNELGEVDWREGERRLVVSLPRPCPAPRLLLQKARGSAPTARVMMKSAKLEWQLNRNEKAVSLLLEAVDRHPEFAKVSVISSFTPV